MHQSILRVKNHLALLFALLLTVTLAACGGGDSVDVDGGSEGGGGGGGEGTLQAAIGGEPDQLDPHLTTSYFSFQVLENVYDTLVEPDENLEMQPALATEWETSEDQLTWTFTIRDGVKFSDGSDLTSEDIAYTYNRIKDEELQPSYRLGSVKTIETPDPKTLVIELAEPQPSLLSALGGYKGMGIVSKENVESGDVKNNPVGSGPFVLEDWSNGSSIKLARNDEYWGEKPALAGVEFTFVKDPTVALQNLQSGEVQWTDNLPPQQVDSLSESEDVVVESAPSQDYWYMSLNHKREPFSDVNVRRAIALALDREDIVKVSKFGNATVNQTAIPETSAWYHEYAPFERDTDEAQQLLEDAGVENLEMDLMVTSEYPETVSAAQVIASQLDEIGVTVKIRELEFPAWLDEQSKGNFDSFMLGWLGNIDPDEFYYSQHHSKGSNNYQGYNNPEVDQLLDEARTETDETARKALYDQIAEQIVDDVSYIYLYNPDVAQGWAPEVSGYEVRSDRAIRFRSVSLGG